MTEKWSVRSVNGTRNEQEGEWTTLDQIQGEQTLLRYNVFGMSFRIIPVGMDKYKISEFRVSPTNSYFQLMKKSGMEPGKIQDVIRKKLEDGQWNSMNIKGLMDYGVVEGIATKLGMEDHDNGTNQRDEFLNDSTIETMREVEEKEYDLSKFKTDKECLEYLTEMKELIGSGDVSDTLVYQNYKTRVEKQEQQGKQEKSGAEQILDFMKEKNLTDQDLSLALAMLQARMSGVEEAEKHVIDEKMGQRDQDEKGPSHGE